MLSDAEIPPWLMAPWLGAKDCGPLAICRGSKEGFQPTVPTCATPCGPKDANGKGTCPKGPNGFHDAAFGGDVKRTGGFIQHEHRRIMVKRPSDANTLALAAGEANTALADQGIEPLWQVGYKFFQLRGTDGSASAAGSVPPTQIQQVQQVVMQHAAGVSDESVEEFVSEIAAADPALQRRMIQ